MTDTVTNVERLRELAEQIITDAPETGSYKFVKSDAYTSVAISDEAHVVQERDIYVVSGSIDTVKAGETAIKTLFTVSFVGDSHEPFTFSRWDDSIEPKNVPKRQRERIARRLVDLLDA